MSLSFRVCVFSFYVSATSLFLFSSLDRCVGVCLFVLRYVIQKNNNLLFYFAVFSFVSLARVRRITNASCAKIVFLSPLLALFVFFFSQIYLLSITQYLFMNEFCFFFFYNSGFCFPHTLLQSFCFNFFPKKNDLRIFYVCFCSVRKSFTQQVTYLPYSAYLEGVFVFFSPKDSDFSHALFQCNHANTRTP